MQFLVGMLVFATLLITGILVLSFRQMPPLLQGRYTIHAIVCNEAGTPVIFEREALYFDGYDTGEMRLDSIHPGATLDKIRDTMGWVPKIADPLPVTPVPTPDEMRLIREELDPEGAYTK